MMRGEGSWRDRKTFINSDSEIKIGEYKEIGEKIDRKDKKSRKGQVF